MSAPAQDVRAAVPADIPQLLHLMKELAAFEGYLTPFAVTEAELLRRGWPGRPVAPEFFALVASGPDHGLAGYAVYYFIPFTYDLKPTLVIKELFVRASHRGAGFGRGLLAGLERLAREHDCGLMKWAVLAGNERARRFYRAWGGEPETRWSFWSRPAR